MPPHFWLWLLIGLSVFGVVYWWIAARELAQQKSALMAKQRTVAQSLGPRILPFRDKIEAWVAELAHDPWPGDEIASEVELAEVRRTPGVYLRLRQANAKERDEIPAAAAVSLHDGFTSCFFIRRGEADPRRGEPCTNLGDCEPGFLCNEWNVCVPPPRPYNLRLAYRALRILSPEWVEQLHEASNDLEVRVQARDLEGVTQNDVPIAIELLSRAEYLTVVLDETPEGGPPPALEDAGAETIDQRLQRSPHYARVGIWDLESERLLVRLRRMASGTLLAVGTRTGQQSRENLAAQQRQTNSCALALAVKQAITEKGAAAALQPDPNTEANEAKAATSEE